MNHIRKALALVLSLCLLSGATLALAEATGAAETPVPSPEVTQAVPVAVPTLADTDVIARVNGQDVTWGDAQPYYASIVNYYGEPDASMLDTYRAFAMETAIVMALSDQTAAANGLDVYTEEEKAAVYASAEADWQAALDNWVANYGGLSATPTDEEKAAAYKSAEAYYAELGYDLERLHADYLHRDTYDRVNAWVTRDVVVTDEEVQARYDQKVASDQLLYENDASAYEMQIMLYENQYATEKPWYHPAGYRYIKHILLEVDATLLSAYTNLQARLEEQMDAEAAAAAAITLPDPATATVDPAAATVDPATATVDPAAATVDPAAVTIEPTASPTPTLPPVTQADVDAAKADILASLQAKIDEINTKVAAGADFDALIAEYAVKADGTATDAGMTSGSYPNGYEVSLASSSFVPEFVEAAFSVNAVGDVSAPFLSQFGVHIVKYMADVPAGPVALDDTLKASIRDALLSDRQNAALDAWQKAATVEYTGLVPSMASLQGETGE